MTAVLVRGYCSAELAFSSPAVAVTIAGTQFTYPRTDEQVGFA